MVDVVAAEPATQEVIVSETRDGAVLGHPVLPVLITAVTKQPSLQTSCTHYHSNKQPTLEVMFGQCEGTK